MIHFGGFLPDIARRLYNFFRTFYESFTFNINNYRERVLKIERENRTFFMNRFFVAQQQNHIQIVLVSLVVMSLFMGFEMRIVSGKIFAIMSVFVLSAYFIVTRNRKKSIDSLLNIIIDSEISPEK